VCEVHLRLAPGTRSAMTRSGRTAVVRRKSGNRIVPRGLIDTRRGLAGRVC
jgi:hypothetical protein